MKQFMFLIAALFLFVNCNNTTNSEKKEQKSVTETHIGNAIEKTIEKFPETDRNLLKRGVNHVASLWRAEDGSPEDFIEFCANNFSGNNKKRELVFNKLSAYYESLFGHFNKISLDLQANVHLQTGELHSIDHMFAGYSAGAHMKNDFYANKIAFVTALNFPYYSTEEKNELGKEWTALEWGYARMGDVFSSRVPSELIQETARVSAESDAYIAEYNIYMGKLVNDKSEHLFPKDMVLLSHWNLRDEIKANYANKTNGLEKQEMIYQVMQRIIDQSIPEKVINSGDYEWNPYNNQVNQEEAAPEPDARYQQILNNFNAFKAIDAYQPVLNTAIKRSFSGNMQIPQEEVEAIFHEFLSSTHLKDAGKIIEKRLGRDLKPWDIWYDGFKARSSISEEKLDAITQKKYPNAQAMEDDLANMLLTLGFTKKKANFLASKIVVDPARGSGHAWGASMKSENAHLRTRIPESGMNYKGYNIAVHEFGHNVEQTISLHDVPNYMINGVPNTAFTEALAFIFQQRDLLLLNMKDNNPDKEYLKTLDIFWSLFEIMGVSMVDMKMWKWMYENPNCTASELKNAVLTISKEVWNQYFAPVYGLKDQTILAVYSHMINAPMYLPNYAFGHLIHFQLEEHFKTNPFAAEVERMFALGQLTPNEWMMEAVGTPLSNEPIINAAQEAIKHLNQ